MRSNPTREPSAAERQPRDALEEALSWALAPAERGDFDCALAWLDTVSYVRGGLPAAWAARRAEWASSASESARAVSAAAVQRRGS